MLDQKWIETFRQEIPAFAQKAAAFDRGEIDRKDYKGVSGGFGSYAQKDPHKHMLRLRMAGGALTPERLAFLAEAAAQVGIYDANYFSRLFKKYLGYAPRYFKHISTAQ